MDQKLIIVSFSFTFMCNMFNKFDNSLASARVQSKRKIFLLETQNILLNTEIKGHRNVGSQCIEACWDDYEE
ncbi:Uncharacterized protein TCM_040933 [Theobroma cacao]|uniref:Uncharacterized protein n=1 Tax=Theobroma cacao TaxID=3641 RepID=A0A061GUP8_THECC|nr:Uncharacterized protein TCM_040933 [Theobroma cacao]